jgi:hypothetical protein
MAAIVIRSLGGIEPALPNTDDGMTYGAAIAAVTATVLRFKNCLREIVSKGNAFK